jgi:hypothetical protein
MSGSTALAQEDEERLEELKDEREKIQIEVAASATKVDAATADFDVVAQALDDMNGLVDLQEARLADARQAVRSAEALVDQAVLRREEIATEMDGLRNVVSDLAVAAFTGESGQNGEDLTAFLLSDDPTEAVRRRSLVQFQTGNLADALDRMRQLEVSRWTEGDGGGATLMGTVPIEQDGSFYLEVPARVPLRLRTLDESGKESFAMRNWFWVMPRESRGCIGCHEDPELTPPNRHVRALRKAAHVLR